MENKLATKRIAEIFNAQLQEFPSGGFGRVEREILAIKTYLDELAEASVRDESKREGRQNG